MTIPTTVRCRCDACDALRAPGTLWTADGYCGFCAQFCHVPMTVNGAFQRAACSREGRLAAHARRLEDQRAANTPTRAPSIDEMIDRIDDPSMRVPLRLTVDALDFLVPNLLPGTKRIWQTMRGKVRR